MPKWCHERFLFVVASRRSFFGAGLLELHRTSPWLRCKKQCLPRKMFFFRKASMPCCCCESAFIKSRCRFGHCSELQCSIEMGFAGQRQGDGAIYRPWDAFGGHFAIPVGPRASGRGYNRAYIPDPGSRDPGCR